MKPKLSFPPGRANENSVLRPPSVLRPVLRTSENISKNIFRARALDSVALPRACVVDSL